MTTMQAIQIREYGDANVLQQRAIPKPIPRPTEAIVRLKAAGVNFIDIYMRTGNPVMPVPLPFIPGVEGSGIVDSIGENVTEVKVGDRVAYVGSLGAYAEYAAVKADQLIPLPDHLSFEEGASLALQGLTAHYLVNDICSIKEGDTVLVHAAAGGVGLLVIQLLKTIGAKVIGTVSTEEKAKIAKHFGADHAIVYTQEDFVTVSKQLTNHQGVNYIIDGVGKDTCLKNLDAVGTRGHICIFGLSSGRADPIEPNLLQLKSITITGGNLMNYITTRKERLQRFHVLAQGIQQGWLKLKIDDGFSLDQVGRAHQLLENRKTTGKLIIKINEE